MSIVFIHPPLSVFPSGGNHYNAKIIQLARQNQFSLSSVSIESSGWLDQVLSDSQILEHSLIVLDSYFIRALRPEKLLPNHPPLALLLHDLPSENPRLTAEQRQVASTAENCAMAVADRYIITGRSVETILRERSPGKPVFFCEPGIDSIFRCNNQSGVREIPDAPVQYLSVANLIPRKGYLELLKILTRLSHHNWYWHVVGDETLDDCYAGSFRKAIERSAISDRITLHGPLASQHLVQLMDKADIFISASSYETYGMALAEAAANHLPVVATRVGDAGFLIKHGETGFLFSVGDGKSFADGLAKLTLDPDLRRYFKNHHRPQPHSWKQTFAEFRAACFCT